MEHIEEVKKPYFEKCPTCGGECEVSFIGLDLVENSGDETLATKCYVSVDFVANEMVSALTEENRKLKEALEHVNHTLVLHGKVDQGTPLHQRIESLLSVETKP